MTKRWLLGLAMLSAAANGFAQHARVLVDGDRLARLPAASRFLLPDGSLLSIQTVIQACSSIQSAGVLYFDPADSSCRSAFVLSPPDLPDTIQLEEGMVVFNRLTRETCLPGRCQVVIAGSGIPPEGEPPVVVDSFTADPSSLTAPGITTLAWASTNADACSVSDDQGGGPQAVAADGFLDRNVAVTTTFTLTCTNPAHSDQAGLVVTVSEGPVSDPIFADRFDATPD